MHTLDVTRVRYLDSSSPCGARTAISRALFTKPHMYVENLLCHRFLADLIFNTATIAARSPPERDALAISRRRQCLVLLLPGFLACNVRPFHPIPRSLRLCPFPDEKLDVSICSKFPHANRGCPLRPCITVGDSRNFRSWNPETVRYDYHGLHDVSSESPVLAWAQRSCSP